LRYFVLILTPHVAAALKRREAMMPPGDVAATGAKTSRQKEACRQRRTARHRHAHVACRHAAANPL